MPIKMAVMLDGGHVRVHARSAGKTYDPAYIEKKWAGVRLDR
jgi:hypothetical protein